MTQRRDYLNEIICDFDGSLEYRVASDSWKFEGESITPAELSGILANRLGAANQPVMNALRDFAWHEYKEHKRGLATWLNRIEAERPADDSLLREWLENMQNPATGQLAAEANVHAMKQWMWNVKQGILGEKLIWHVCPVFWCKMNGTGKSQNVGTEIGILRPLAQFTRSLTAEDLNEKFSGKMLARTLVTLLDEFEGVPGPMVPVIKSILTGKPFDRRGMMSESGFFAENRMSAIATSNKEPPHGFYDETGARRFWSIHSREEQLKGTPRAQWFRDLDIDTFWMAVRSSDPAPEVTMSPELSEFMGKIRDEKLRTKSTIESFLADATEEEKGHVLPIGAVLNGYRAYCAKTGLPALRLNHTAFADKLAALEVEVKRPGNRPEVHNIRVLAEYMPEP